MVTSPLDQRRVAMTGTMSYGRTAPYGSIHDDAPDTLSRMTENARRVALTDWAYSRLLEMIMDGTLTPSAPLRIVKLSEQLGMSPTPLREALQLLAGEGLVERLPMKGFKVSRPLSPEEQADLVHARVVLEPEIASLAAERGTAEGIARLNANLDATSRVSVGKTFEEYKEYLELSAQFHSLIASISGNKFLAASLEALPVHLQRFRLFGEEGVTDVDVSIAEHRAIYEAIASSDPARARAAMTDHICGVAARSS